MTSIRCAHLMKISSRNFSEPTNINSKSDLEHKTKVCFVCCFADGCAIAAYGMYAGSNMHLFGNILRVSPVTKERTCSFVFIPCVLFLSEQCTACA